MKKWLGIALIASIVSFSACQESVDKKKNDIIKKYKHVLSINDLNSACFYLQEYLFLDSSNVAYKDSLAQYYLRLNNSAAAAEMAKQVIEVDPLNEKMNEILIISDLGNRDVLTAMARFDKMYEKTKDKKFLFKKGFTYVDIGQPGKGLEIAEEFLKMPDNALKTVKVSLISDPNKQQDVKIKAAALALKAYAYMKGTQNPLSKETYALINEALSIQNNFELAQALAQEFPQVKK